MGKSSIDQNGFRRQEANPVSMVGVFPYTGEQIDYDGALGLDPKKIYWVFRGPEELFNPEALASFNGIPIRVGHIMLGKGFKAVDDEPADGCIFNARQSMDMPEYLIAEFCIYTEKMKSVLDKGKVKQLSLGYRCQYVPCVGSYKGKPYEFKQVNLRGNHLALVEHGRCGSSVRVCDQALITFDSLPEEMLGMTQEENKGIENARKLAEAVKNGDEQACQDCLDFYNLSPEQRKEALAFVKNAKKDDPKATAEDSKAKTGKDEVPPPPPPPEGEKKTEGEQKPDDAAAAAAAAAGAEAKPEEQKPEEQKPEGHVATDKGCKKEGCNDEATTVTEPTAQVPVQKLQDGEQKPAEEKKDEGKTEEPKAQDEAQKTAGNSAEQPKTEGSLANKPELGKERDINVKPAATQDEKPNDKGGAETPKEESHVEKPVDHDGAAKPTQTTPVTVTDPDKEAAKVAGVPKVEDAKPEEQKPAEEQKPEEQKPAEECGKTGCFSQDEYKACIAEYKNAQLLADAVRPYIKETFDSALMREIDVAKFAVKHIDSLAFAADEADEVILGVVRGHVAKIATDEANAKPKTYVMDEAIKTPTAQDEAPKAAPVDAKKALAEYYSKK